MTEKMTIQELTAKLSEFDYLIEKEIVHIKSNGIYVITGIHYLETNMHIYFAYQPKGEAVSFLRPIEELLDGRFKTNG